MRNNAHPKNICRDHYRSFWHGRMSPSDNLDGRRDQIIIKHGNKGDGSSGVQHLVGSPIYYTLTQPKLTFSISYMSMFMSKPQDLHTQVAKKNL